MSFQKLAVDFEKCIACQACTNTCPEGLITFEDVQSLRIIRWAEYCSENCTRCADACSEKAIRLESAAEAPAETGRLTAEFPLANCSECRVPFVPERMIEKLNTTLAGYQDQETWNTACLACRREAEARRAAGRWVMLRY